MENPDFDGYDESEVAIERRRGRKTSAENFRGEYFYGRCMDKKTCIWPSCRDSWSDDSSGITWVGVHGNDSICVVTKAVDLDVTRVHGFLIFLTKEKVLRTFRRTVISEIEDLADPSSKLREMLDQSIEIPFGVVSVVPATDKVHKASSDEYQESKIMKYILEDLNRENGEETSSDDEYENEDDEVAAIKYSLKLTRRGQVRDVYDEKNTIRLLKEEMKREEKKRDASITINEAAVQESIDEYDERKAIEFLQEKVKRGEDFTLEGTIQTTIYAFQHLFKKKFKANEIEVCVMDPNYFVSAEEAYSKDIYVKHLETSEIEQLLADMNEPGSGRL